MKRATTLIAHAAAALAAFSAKAETTPIAAPKPPAKAARRASDTSYYRADRRNAWRAQSSLPWETWSKQPPTVYRPHQPKGKVYDRRGKR